MIRTLRLYAAAIVLIVWAVSWQLGVQGDVVIAVGLTLTATAVVVAVWEQERRSQQRSQQRQARYR